MKEFILQKLHSYQLNVCTLGQFNMRCYTETALTGDSDRVSALINDPEQDRVNNTFKPDRCGQVRQRLSPSVGLNQTSDR
jgi:hypothetical protein